MAKERTFFERMNLPDRNVLDADLAERLRRASAHTEDWQAGMPAAFTRGEVTALLNAWVNTEHALHTARDAATKAERREAQFSNWWTGVKAELDALKRKVAGMVTLSSAELDTLLQTAYLLDGPGSELRKKLSAERDRIAKWEAS